MTQNECASCHAFLPADGIECPECGLPVQNPPAIADSAPRAAPDRESSDAGSAPDLTPGMLPTRRGPVLAMLATAALACWFLFYAALGWISYRDGYQGLLVPSWNTALACWMVAVAEGVRRHHTWAWRWALGIAFVNGLVMAMYAARLGSDLLWVGVAVHAGCLLAVRAAWGRVARAPASTIGKGLSWLALGASLVVGVIADRQPPGNEHGRTNIAAEMQRAYDAVVPGQVRVLAAGRALVIEAPGDSDAAIDAAADRMQADLQKVGRTAKAWMVGFERIRITNRRAERILLRDR